MTQVAERLRQYLPGWKSYFRLVETPTTFQNLDSWIRHRLRAVQLKHWRRGPTVYRGLRSLGASVHIPVKVDTQSGKVDSDSDSSWTASPIQGGHSVR